MITDMISGHDRRTEKGKVSYRDASNLKTYICIPKDAVPERRIQCGNTFYTCFTLLKQCRLQMNLPLFIIQYFRHLDIIYTKYLNTI